MAKAISVARSANASFFGDVPLHEFEIVKGIREGGTAGVCSSSGFGLDKLNNLHCNLRDGRAEYAARSFGYLGLECAINTAHSRSVPLSRLTSKLGIWQNVAFGQNDSVFSSNSRTKKCKRRAIVTRGVNGAFWEGADGESTSDLWVPSEAAEGVNLTSESLLLNMVQDIEPLDISTISKDASPDSTSAMKRTISGMLGLLPSDQFEVTIETSPDQLARLLVSSMMTGYTLRNAEYRLSLQRTLELSLDDISYQDYHRKQEENRDFNAPQLHSSDHHIKDTGVSDLYREFEQIKLPTELGGVSSKVADYIQQLQQKLTATSKELEACRMNMKNAVSSSEIKLEKGLATRNDLLDYLRSLEPEKVAELSQSSKEVQEAIEQVVAGLLGTMVSKPKPSIPPFGTSSISSPWDECEPSEVVGNVPLQFQSIVTSSRDYLARLLFWCTLLGYYMRGLEYRLELSRTLSLSGESVLDVEDEKHDTWGDWSDSRS